MMTLRRRKRFNEWLAEEPTNIRPPSSYPENWAGDGKQSYKTVLPFNQSNVSRARTFLGFLDRELDTLAFPQQLKHRAPHGAAMKEMLEAGFIADEAEALVD